MTEAAARTEPPPAAVLAVDIELADPAWADAVKGVEDMCARALQAAFTGALKAGAGADLGGRMAEVSLVLAGDAQVADLNAHYRGKDGPTNVLSFPAHEEGAPAAAEPALPVLLGDVIVAFGVAGREAREQDIPLAGHLTHLVVHGMLHLLGFDHMDAAEADRMERLETAILGGLGVPDPYGKEQ